MTILRPDTGRPWTRLGGGLSNSIVDGRVAGLVEKRHLVLKRLAQDRTSSGRELIDLGTDYRYPFFDDYPPAVEAMSAVQTAFERLRNYPSSYGTVELRRELAAFYRENFNVAVDDKREVMVSAGASQVFDAISRSFAGRYVLVPHLALSTVTSISTGNGAEVRRYKLRDDLTPDIEALEQQVRGLGGSAIRFIYLNSPANPTGAVTSLESMASLVEIGRKHGVIILHDHDSWRTTHVGETGRSILEVPGALDVAVSVMSLSKEFGLPGLRIGAVAGSAEVINVLRIHNSEFCVMLPEVMQAAAAAAFRAFRRDGSRTVEDSRIGDALAAALSGWKALGWPSDAIYPPAAGFKFVLGAPPAFRNAQLQPSGAELFDFLVATTAAVKLSTARSFNPGVGDLIRVIIMQDPEVVEAAFARMEAAGIHYEMSMPEALESQYADFFSEVDLWDL